MLLLGKDSDGITQVSVEALMKLYVDGEKLKEIRIYGTSPIGTICYFEFEGDKVYKASGFSIGYGGEGPHGLWKMIRTFYPDKISADFWETLILRLEGDWQWTPDKGFNAI